MELLIEKIRSLKDVFEPLDFCVFIKDPQGRIVYSNPTFAKYAGMSQGDVMFERPMDFLQGNPIQIRETYLDDVRILSGETASTSRLMFLKNGAGENIVMRVIKTPLKNKKQTVGILCIAEDYSASYRLHYIGMHRAVSKLSPKEKMILFQYSRGLSRAEVARSLNMLPSTADTIWQRTREKLQLSGDDLAYFLRFYNDLLDNIYPPEQN